MYHGDCYPNGSYFSDVAITIGHPKFHYLQCVLPSSTLSGGEWSRSNGGPVDCNNNNDTDPLRCNMTNTTTTPATLSLYRPSEQHFPPSEDQLYKCCLPTSCSNPTSSIITAHIFSKCYLIVLVHTVIYYCRKCTNS